MLGNLLENALRHQPDGTPVSVTTSTLGARTEIRVVDTGAGVGQEDRDRIFRPFQRVGDAPAGEGVGLGLAVARGLTEAMGGTLAADDTPGGGLTMIVTLPGEPGEAGLPSEASSMNDRGAAVDTGDTGDTDGTGDMDKEGRRR